MPDPHQAQFSDTPATVFRAATPEDALSISVLAMQVFLDTYATAGMRADLAREALGMYDAASLAVTIAESPHRFTVADRNGYLVGFSEIERTVNPPNPTPANGLQCKRLYVQRHFKRMGIGQALLHNVELMAAKSSLSCVWLNAWIGNAAAITFYEKMGYIDIGRTLHHFEGVDHENIIFCKHTA